MAADVEIHVPISPTESFFGQVHYLLESLRRHGGRLRDAPVIVTVGEDCEPFDIARRLSWSRDYPVEFRWVLRSWYRTKFATGMDRCLYDFRKPWVLLLDADMVFTKDIDDLLDRAAADPALHAVICHGSPWQYNGLLDIRSNEEWWRVAFKTAGLDEPSLDLEYSGYGLLSGVPRSCPHYFNFGVVLAPSEMMRAVGRTIHREREVVDNIGATHWRAQVALTLAIARHGIPWRALPLRYNFPPALHWYLPKYQSEWDDVRIIHYGGGYQSFNVNLVMENPAAMAHWLGQDRGDSIEAHFRTVIRELHSTVSLYRSPEPWYSAESVNRFPGGRPITVVDIQEGWKPSKTLIRKRTKVLPLGRRFSREVGRFLSREDYNQWQIPKEPNLHPGANLLESLWLTFEDIFITLQHFQWAFGEVTPRSRLWLTHDRSFFNPSEPRREKVGSALKEADVFVITLHSSELWMDRITNQPAWKTVLDDDDDPQRYVFVGATVAQTLGALRELDRLMDRYMPDKRIIFALWPAPLEITFRPESVITATQASKSVLKAALDEFLSDQLIQTKDRYSYFPSYEIAWHLFDRPFLPVGSDVRPEVTAALLDAFGTMFTDMPADLPMKAASDPLQALQDHVRELEKQLNEKEEIIRNLDAAARERLSLVECLTREIGVREARIQELERASPTV